MQHCLPICNRSSPRERKFCNCILYQLGLGHSNNHDDHNIAFVIMTFLHLFRRCNRWQTRADRVPAAQWVTVPELQVYIQQCSHGRGGRQLLFHIHRCRIVYGRENDASIFSKSTFGQRLAREELQLPTAGEGGLEYVFVGDEAFQLQHRVLRPYPGSRLGGAESDYHRRLVYNYRLSRARRIVENTFGILVSKWRVLRQPIKAKIETIDSIVKASCVLHNYLRRRDGISNDRRYIADGDVDADDSGHLTRGAWRHEDSESCFRNIGRLGSNNSTRRASELRERYAAYFVSPEGSVPWQDGVVRRGRLI